jgi:hypothetical protein
MCPGAPHHGAQQLAHEEKAQQGQTCSNDEPSQAERVYGIGISPWEHRHDASLALLDAAL